MMKKFLLCAMIFALLFSFCSCNNNNGDIEVFSTNNKEISAEEESNFPLRNEYLNSICEVDRGVYAEEKDFNHSNVISDAPTEYFDKTVAPQKTVCINGTNVEVNYDTTLQYPIGSEPLHRYRLNSTGKYDFVLFTTEGNIASMPCDFAEIDISPTATSEEVYKILEKEWGNLVDISKYQYFSTSVSGRLDGTGFGIYTYLRYNMTGDIITDWSNISVSDDGKVFAFNTTNFPSDVDSINIEIDEDLLHKALDTKMRDIYDVDNVEYVSYVLSSEYQPRVSFYENQPCVIYTVSAKFIFDGTELTSFLNEILIPIKLIQKQ